MRYRLLIALAASLTLALLMPSPSFAASSTTTGGSVSGGTFSASGGMSTSTLPTNTTGSPPSSAGGSQTSTTSSNPAGPAPVPTSCTPVWTSNEAVTSSCVSQLPGNGTTCVTSSTQVTLYGVALGLAEQMGSWAVIWTSQVGRNGGKRVGTATCIADNPVTITWIAYAPPVPPTVTLGWTIVKTLPASVHIHAPTPWIMPSPAHPGPPPCSACVTPQERREGYANHPEWLAVEQGPGVTSGLSMVRSATFPGGTATVGVTLTPETVNFEWIGADSYPPFNAPVHTVSCPAGAIVTGAPAPLGYAPSSYSLARAYDTWQHALWWQWFDKHAIYGGPGCDGSRWEGGNGTPRQEVDYLQGVGGGHPRVEFYTPRQVTRADCIDVGNTVANPWPAWCYQVPLVDTIHAYLTYHIAWTFGGVLAGATPPGLPTTYNVMTQDLAAVATTTLPVVAEHTHPTCFSGTGSRQQCNVNTPPGTGDMGPAPING